MLNIYLFIYVIGISAGKLSKVIVGDETKQYCVVIGRAVDEVRLAEGLAEAGTIILSPNAWELCERQNFAIDHIENERAVKVVLHTQRFINFFHFLLLMLCVGLVGTVHQESTFFFCGKLS